MTMTPGTLQPRTDPDTLWCVTGGAGFIGANFVRLALSETRARLVVLDKLTYAGSLENLRGVLDDERVVFVHADIADRAAIERAFFAHRPAAVVNFAAETHVDRSIDSPDAFVQTNLVGTFSLLEAARRYHASLEPPARNAFRLLHISTDEVYGSLGDEGLFEETTPYAPNSPYAASKAGADHLVRAYHQTYGLPTLLTNCSNNYGPYQFPEKLIPLTILNALDERPLPIYGRGDQVRDWLHVDDHCLGILRVLAAGRTGEKYHIGGHNERTNLQVVDAICTLLDAVRPRVTRGADGSSTHATLKTFVTDRPGHDRRYAIDATKIERELRWRPRHTFEDGLRQTVRWYLENRAWCEAVQKGTYTRERLGLGATGQA